MERRRFVNIAQSQESRHVLIVHCTKVGEIMKRLWPEEDDMFWIAVFIAAFFTFCLSFLYAMG